MLRDIADVIDRYRADAKEVRAIAEGIYDHEERMKLLQFVDAYERLARSLKVDISTLS